MVALAERLRLELDSSDRKNLVGSQIIPDKSACRQRLPVTAGAIVGTNPTDESIPQLKTGNQTGESL